MAVIDIETGKEELPPGQRIINLETGGYEELQGPLGTPGPTIPINREPVEQYPGRESRATQELPEMTFSGLLSNEDPVKVIKAASAIVTATNPREIGDILSNTFSNIGITEDEKGNLIANNRKTGVQAVINKPGASPLDVIQAIGITSAFVPSAGATSMVTGAVPKMIAGGAGAGLTQSFIEAGQQTQGGQFDIGETAMATGIGAVGEGFMPFFQWLRSGPLQRQAAAAGQSIDDVATQVRRAEAASDATGIPLYPAQKTTIPAELERQSFVSLLPAGTSRSYQALIRQNQAAAAAVDDFLKMIAPDESIVTGAQRFRTAAQRAIENAKRVRRERTSPLYQQAFKTGADIDLGPVNELIEQGLKDYPEGGEVYKSLQKINTMINGKGAKDIAPAGSKAAADISSRVRTLKQLHNTKLEIDQMIQSRGQDSLGNTTKRELLEIQETLLRQMDEGSDLYKAAREKFATESPAVTRLTDESIIGKIADMDDTKLKSISRTIFDPAETNPAVIRHAKKVISDVDPDAWNELLRVEIERRMGSIRSAMESGSVENIPGQLYTAIFGNTKQRNVLFHAVDGDLKKNLEYLKTALGRARLGRPGGSQTAGRQEMMRELRGGVRQAITNFFEGPVSGMASMASTAVTGSTADAAFDARVRALAKVLFDPDWAPKAKELRKLDSSTPAAARAMAQLLDDALKTDIENFQDFQEGE